VLASSPASSAAAFPLWLQISLALAAPSVALLVGFLSVRQQNRGLAHDREMRTLERRNQHLANAISVFSRVDHAIERLRTATDGGHADPRSLGDEILEVVRGQDVVMTAEAELLLVIPRDSRLGTIAMSAVLSIQELAVNIREPPPTGAELYELVEGNGEAFQESLYEFVEEARAVALGGPIHAAQVEDSPDPT
jgi:hypothetical protein